MALLWCARCDRVPEMLWPAPRMVMRFTKSAEVAQFTSRTSMPACLASCGASGQVYSEVNSAGDCTTTDGKWDLWLGTSQKGLKVPDMGATGMQGTWLGSRYVGTGQYRPSCNSMMNSLFGESVDTSFNSVSREQMIFSIWRAVTPIDTRSSSSARIASTRRRPGRAARDPRRRQGHAANARVLRSFARAAKQSGRGAANRRSTRPARTRFAAQPRRPSEDCRRGQEMNDVPSRRPVTV